MWPCHYFFWSKQNKIWKKYTRKILPNFISDNYRDIVNAVFVLYCCISKKYLFSLQSIFPTLYRVDSSWRGIFAPFFKKTFYSAIGWNVQKVVRKFVRNWFVRFLLTKMEKRQCLLKIAWFKCDLIPREPYRAAKLVGYQAHK